MNRVFRESVRLPAARYTHFNYPHTFRSVNNKFNALFKGLKPQEHGELKPGDSAPQAYTGVVREFPEWYKPYYLNYRRDGFFITIFALSCLYAFSFNYQLNLLKGRKKRINYNKKSELNTFNGGSWHYTRKVIDKEEYAKFLVPRPH